MTSEKPAEKPEPAKPTVFPNLGQAITSHPDGKVYKVWKAGKTYYAVAVSPQDAMDEVMQSEGFTVELVKIKDKYRAAIEAFK